MSLNRIFSQEESKEFNSNTSLHSQLLMQVVFTFSFSVMDGYYYIILLNILFYFMLIVMRQNWIDVMLRDEFTFRYF